MGCDDELGLRLDQLLHGDQEAELTGGRERRLWLVEQIQSVAVQPVQDQSEKGLAVRLLVGRPSAAMLPLDTIRFRGGGHVIEAFRAKEVPVRVPTRTTSEAEVLVQLGMGSPGCEPEIAGAAFRVEARSHRNGLQQRGFAAPILADEEGDGGGELQVV